MVPKIASAGRSFKGAALYYLHDKKANTADRVAFIETVNLPTKDARGAIAHMIDTATHAAELKKAAGLKAGRTLQQPVYCYSLAWHPSEAPTQADQVQAARESLRALGVADRQALIVSHNDTDHPHVHVILNRVCPETGRAAVMSNDRLALSQWAEDYEKRHGKIHCQVRVQNNADRQKGHWRKDQSPSRQAAFEWKKQTTADLWNEYRGERDGAKESRKGQCDALWQQREGRMATRKAEIKQAFKPAWRDLYKQQKRDLKAYDTSLISRLSFALSHYEKGRGMAVLRAFSNDQEQRKEFIREQEKARAALSEKQLNIVRDAGREVTKAWKYDRDQLREMHKAEDARRLEHYREQTDRVWNQPKVETPTAREFEKADNPREEPPRKTNAEIVATEMQKKRERSHGRTRRRPR